MTFPSEYGKAHPEDPPAGTLVSREPREPKTTFVVALFLLWLILEIGLQWTRAPNLDEGLYSLPAHNVLKYGTWDSREIEPSTFFLISSDRPLTRIDKRTYYQMPLYLFAEAIWYRAFGWGLKQQRLLGLCCSIGAIVLWFRLLRLWSGCDRIALTAAVFIAFEWQYVVAGAFGRPDMLAHLLGLLAFYIHERYYRSAPVRTCAAVGLFLSAAAFTHPNAAIIWGGVYLWRFIGQRRAWSLAQFGSFAAVGVFAIACFAVWVSYDPVAFRDQMVTNSVYRFTWSGNGFHAISAEVKRYLGMYGFQPDRPAGPALAKLYSLFPVAAALALMLVSRLARKTEGLKRCMGAGGIAMAVLALADRTGFAQYGLHVTPWFGAVAGFVFGSKFTGKTLARVVLMAYAGAATIVVGGAMYQNPYRNTYLPAVAALSQLRHSDSTVFAPPEFHFAYTGPFIFDVRFGSRSGRTVPAIAATKTSLFGTMDWARTHNPSHYAYMLNMMSHCHLCFENRMYVVYDCHQ